MNEPIQLREYEYVGTPDRLMELLQDAPFCYVCCFDGREEDDHTPVLYDSYDSNKKEFKFVATANRDITLSLNGIARDRTRVYIPQKVTPINEYMFERLTEKWNDQLIVGKAYHLVDTSSCRYREFDAVLIKITDTQLIFRFFTKEDMPVLEIAGYNMHEWECYPLHIK